MRDGRGMSGRRKPLRAAGCKSFRWEISSAAGADDTGPGRQNFDQLAPVALRLEEIREASACGACCFQHSLAVAPWLARERRLVELPHHPRLHAAQLEDQPAEVHLTVVVELMESRSARRARAQQPMLALDPVPLLAPYHDVGCADL